MSDRRSVPVPVLLTATTGALCCDFQDFAEFAQWFLGRPIWTHEYPMVWTAIRDGVRAQHPSLPLEDEAKIDSENVVAKTTEYVSLLGTHLDVERRPLPRTESPLASAYRAVGKRP